MIIWFTWLYLQENWMLSSNKPQEKIKAQVQINPKQHHALTTVVRLLHRPKLQVFCSESNMVVKDVRYLSKSEAAVHKCLQPFTEKGLFKIIFLLNLQACSLFQWVCLIFQNSFLAKHVWVLAASAKYTHFLCCIDLISKMLLSTLAMFWLSLNFSRVNTVSRLWIAVSGSPRQLVDLLLIKKQYVQNVPRKQEQSTSSFI